MPDIGPGMGILALVALIIWLVILVWLAERVLRFVGLRTSWGPLDPRNMLIALTMLVGAIHLGNYAIDLISGNGAALGFPGAFLIGSVAIGVGIAAVRWHRKQTPRK